MSSAPISISHRLSGDVVASSLFFPRRPPERPGEPTRRLEFFQFFYLHFEGGVDRGTTKNFNCGDICGLKKKKMESHLVLLASSFHIFSCLGHFLLVLVKYLEGDLLGPLSCG